jgi:lipopolysaccharide export system permease protein
MHAVHKYLTTQVVKYFCLVLMAVVGIYVVVDFFERIDDLLEASLPLSRSLVFFGLRIPSIVSQVMPVGVLLSVIIVIGLMVRHNETVALKSGGVSNYYLVKPVIVASLVFGSLFFFLSEVLVPITMARANSIWKNEVKTGSAVTAKRRNIWIKGRRAIIHVRYFSPSHKAIFGVTANFYDENFRLVKRIDAKKGLYKGDLWRLFHVIQQDLVKEEGIYRVTPVPESSVDLHFLPEDLKKALRKGGEMSYGELSSYIREAETEGYDATSYRVDLQAKIAFPFVCVIMGLVGCGLVLWRQKQDGLAGSIIYGIALAFFYWTLHSFCLSLGAGGRLPPIVAVWMSNVVFFSLGCIMLIRSR